MNTLHRIDLTQITATHATDQQPITLHYGQHFTARHHQRTYSHYPTAASQIINPQDIHKKGKDEPFQIQKQEYSKQIQRENAKQRGNSVHKILTVRQIKQASRNLQKIVQNNFSTLINQSNPNQARIQLGGQSNKKRIQLSKNLQPLGQNLSC